MPALMGCALFGDRAEMGYALVLAGLAVTPLACRGVGWRRLTAVRG